MIRRAEKHILTTASANQLGALGLVVNAIILWDTRYMERALKQLRGYGVDVRSEDIARLSPLGFQHIHMLGRCSFDLLESLARGELRPLRDPNDPEEQELQVPNTGLTFHCYSKPTHFGWPTAQAANLGPVSKRALRCGHRTVRLRTNASKRLRVPDNALYLVFKLVLRLSLNWRRINAPNQLRLLLDGHQFQDGQLLLEDVRGPTLTQAVGA